MTWGCNLLWEIEDYEKTEEAEDYICNWKFKNCKEEKERKDFTEENNCYWRSKYYLYLLEITVRTKLLFDRFI